MEVKGAGVGIEIRGAASPSVRASAIRDSLAEGVLILGASSPWLSHNLIQNIKGAGVAARDGAHPSLLGNVVEHNVLELPGATEAVKDLNFLLDPPKPARGPRARPTGGVQ